MLLIKEDDVKALLTMEKSVAAVEEAYRDFGNNEAAMTMRYNFMLGQSQGIKTGCAGLMRRGYMGSISYTAGFGKKGTNPSTALLYDFKTGKLLAMIECLHLKWFRTGATAGVAAKHLAAKGTSSAGIIGSGRQAHTQMLGLKAALKISEFKVYSPTRENREKFAREASEQFDMSVEAVDSPDICIADVGVVSTCSTSKQPVFPDRALASGVHVNVIGAHTPTTREVETGTVVRSKVVVDNREQALDENGNILIPMREGAFGAEKISADLGAVVSGRTPIRSGSSDNTIFFSGGVALDQIAIASTVYEEAIKAGIGISVG